MRLVLSWLREFVDVKASAEDVAGTLALRGFEVASIEPLDAGDAVIDFEVTANRPDALSVLGLAREVATAYDLPLIPPAASPNARLAQVPTGASDRVSVSIDDEELCPRYAAAVADVRVAPSPAWLARRLQAAGIRPISNIVDITNYVNIELGQPMHAFDLPRLAGAEIRVRRARPGERITTLDGIPRTLEPDMLVIADRDRAQAIGGVMGGADSEVSSATATVVFESAYFKAASVRRTSKRLGLKTEASSRFERGADISGQVVALQRAIALMQQIDAGRSTGSIVDRYPNLRHPKHLHLRRERLARLLGASVPDGEVVRTLRALGLEVTPAADGWDAVAPTFRVDLLREADLIEEVGRHHGFDKLEPTFPVVTRPAPAPDPRIARDRLVRRVLTAAGFSEAVTFGFIEAKTVEDFQKEPQRPQNSQSNDVSAISALSAVNATIGIANPLSAKFDTLRPSLFQALWTLLRTTGVTAGATFSSSSSGPASRRPVKREPSPWAGPERAHRSTGRAARATSTSSTSRARWSISARRLASPRASRRSASRFWSLDKLPRSSSPTDPSAEPGSAASASSLRRSLMRAACRVRIGYSSPRSISISSSARASRRAMPHGRFPAFHSSFAISPSSSPIPCLRKSFVAPF
jgi:phenylalanyl-tRNA synthetase beta chain